MHLGQKPLGFSLKNIFLFATMEGGINTNAPAIIAL